MGLSIQQSIQRQLNQAIANMEKESAKIAIQTAKAVLSRNKSTYTKKLRSIINSQYYQRYAESEYYERTYQFRDRAYCKPIIDGDDIAIEIWFDIDRVAVFAPTRSNYLYSYAYSWGSREGQFIGTDLVEELYEGFLDRTSILEEFIEWFQDDFQIKFETLFNQRIQSLNK